MSIRGIDNIIQWVLKNIDLDITSAHECMLNFWVRDIIVL